MIIEEKDILFIHFILNGGLKFRPHPITSFGELSPSFPPSQRILSAFRFSNGIISN
jgi:hypothetical protein